MEAQQVSAWHFKIEMVEKRAAALTSHGGSNKYISCAMVLIARIVQG